MKNFVKIVHPADMFVYASRRSPIFCQIKWQDGKLSITGVVGPERGGNAAGGCGQIDMEFAHRDPKDDDKRYHSLTKPSDLRFTKGWNTDLWFDFLSAWKTYHLNDTHSECDHQRAMGWTYEKNTGQKCPVCGYEIGTGWQIITVPNEVLVFLASLPDTDKTPAWV
jgi:hypothetical protein